MQAQAQRMRGPQPADPADRNMTRISVKNEREPRDRRTERSTIAAAAAGSITAERRIGRQGPVGPSLDAGSCRNTDRRYASPMGLTSVALCPSDMRLTPRQRSYESVRRALHSQGPSVRKRVTVSQKLFPDESVTGNRDTERRVTEEPDTREENKEANTDGPHLCCEGGPLQLRCALCPESPTSWQRDSEVSQ